MAALRHSSRKVSMFSVITNPPSSRGESVGTASPAACRQHSTVCHDEVQYEASRCSVRPSLQRQLRKLGNAQIELDS